MSSFGDEKGFDLKNANDHTASVEGLGDDVGVYPLNHDQNNDGMYSAVFNLTTTVIGAGIMALPATMKVLGLTFGFLLIIFMGILSEITVELLVRYSIYCKASSYGEVVQL